MQNWIDELGEDTAKCDRENRENSRRYDREINEGSIDYDDKMKRNIKQYGGN